MERTERDELVIEYFDSLSCNICRLFQYSGVFRYGMGRRGFLRDSRWATLRSICLGVLLTLCCAFFSYQTAAHCFLSTNEMVMAAILAAYGNSMNVNVNFVNRRAYLELIAACVDVDAFLGARKTRFMRSVSHAQFRLTIVAYSLIMAGTAAATLLRYGGVYSAAVIALGLLMIGIMYAMLAYVNLLILSYIFLSMRVRYLNVALLKLYSADGHDRFIKKTILFDGFIWKVNYNVAVGLESGRFEDAYRLVFKVLRKMEKCFQFILLSGSCVVTIGLFLGIQFIINYLKYDEPSNTLRLLVITLWIPLSWLMKFNTGSIVDIFLNEITTSRHVCAAMLLQPRLDGAQRRVAERVSSTLQAKEAQLRVYGMYEYNSATALRSTAALFLFVVMQLQYSFPSQL